MKLLVTQNSYNVLSTQLSEALTIHATDTVFDRCLEIEEYHTCMHVQYAVASQRLLPLSLLQMKCTDVHTVTSKQLYRLLHYSAVSSSAHKWPTKVHYMS